MRLKVWGPLAIVAVLCGALPVQAQSTRIEDLGVGKLLVATRDTFDPNFAETVILLVQYDHDSAVGLIVNRRTKAPISRVLQEMKAAKQRTDPVYLGGPVELSGVLALLRSRTKPGDSKQVLGDVYLVSSRPVLEKALAAGLESRQLRVYLGYSGWGPGQLENEMRLGGWYIFDGNANLVFDPDPASVWERLIARTEEEARLGPEPSHALCCKPFRAEKPPLVQPRLQAWDAAAVAGAPTRDASRTSTSLPVCTS